MTSHAIETESEPSQTAVIDILQRLWQTKLSSIALIEKWLSETPDTEIKAGLTNQLGDERRHARMIGEQIRRLGGRVGSHFPKDAATRVFDEAGHDREDVHRMFAFHHGVKAYTMDRCSHLIPYVDAMLGSVLEALTRDEERHIRWADMRLERLLTREKLRECNMLLGRVKTQLESGWGKQWRHLTLRSWRRPAA